MKRKGGITIVTIKGKVIAGVLALGVTAGGAYAYTEYNSPINKIIRAEQNLITQYKDYSEKNFPVETKWADLTKSKVKSIGFSEDGTENSFGFFFNGEGKGAIALSDKDSGIVIKDENKGEISFSHDGTSILLDVKKYLSGKDNAKVYLDNYIIGSSLSQILGKNSDLSLDDYKSIFEAIDENKIKEENGKITITFDKAHATQIVNKIKEVTKDKNLNFVTDTLEQIIAEDFKTTSISYIINGKETRREVVNEDKNVNVTTNFDTNNISAKIESPGTNFEIKSEADNSKSTTTKFSTNGEVGYEIKTNILDETTSEATFTSLEDGVTLNSTSKLEGDILKGQVSYKNTKWNYEVRNDSTIPTSSAQVQKKFEELTSEEKAEATIAILEKISTLILR